MHSDCIKKVTAAAGKALSAGKIKAIEEAISGKMRDLARQDPAAWQAKSYDQRVTEAAQAAMHDIQAEAARTEYLGTRQLLATAETNQRIITAKQASAMDLTQSQAYIRDIQNSDNYVHSLHTEAVSNLTAMIDAAESRDGTGLLRNLGIRLLSMDNPQMTADVVREIYKGADGHTGNRAAQAGARAWLDTIESLRLRFNAAGGDVGKLAYGYLSQIHDAVKIMAVDAATWAQKVLPLLDRKQYLNTDGSLMTNAQLLPVLEGVHATLASNGLNKVEPGQYKGIGKRANAGSDRRVLHFQDGDAWMAYMKDFGEGSLYDAMLGHVGHMTRNIGLVERYGPNPEMQHRLQADIAMRADNPVGKTFKEIKDSRSWGNETQAYWDILSGKTGSPENAWIARQMQHARNVETAAKITWGPFAAMSDPATILMGLHYNRLPYFEMIKNIGKQFSNEHREFMQAHQVIAENLTSTLNRFTGDNMTHSFTGRITNAVMKLSLMNAWTDGLRSAFSATMMQGFAKKVGTAWGKLDQWDQFLMTRKGITEPDWAIISQAKPTERDGVQYLTRDSITATGADGAEQAATKWMAFVSDEAQFAVINPDMATRAIVTGGGKPAGTVGGEAFRSLGQFKSFPTAMITRQWGRIFDTPQGLEGAPAGFGASTGASGTVNRIAVLAALNVTATLLGAIQNQSRQILTGKDPIDMTGEHGLKFWTKAFAAGGGAGFLADVLLAPADDPSRQWQGHLGLAGPVAGAAGGLVDIAKDKHHAARAIGWVSDQAPGVDMWQVRAAYEHWFLHNAQELVNPGYLDRMRDRARRDWNQDWYWQPGEALPRRSPE